MVKEIIDLGDSKYWNYNACVGTNGFVSDQLYLDGFVEATKQLCIVVLTKDRFLADSLVYPIIFSARHSIELAIKIAFSKDLLLNKDKNSKPLNGHNINWLYKRLKEYSIFDKHILKSLNEIEDSIPNTIMQIIKIDTSGETFRYRTNKEESNHLDGIVRHINIRKVYIEYCEFFEKIDDFLIGLDPFIDSIE